MNSLIPFCLATCLASLAQATEFPHLPPDMDGLEYRNLLAPSSPWRPELREDDPLTEIIALGQRNLSWFEAVNAARPRDQQLELTTRESTIGYPLEHPNESNRAIILQKRANVLAAMPEAMREVIWGTGPLPDVPPVSDEVFLTHVRALDRVYQAASRWLLQEPLLGAYAQRVMDDVRGYVFLSREADLDAKLESWSDQPDEVRARLRPWLVDLCVNAAEARATCEQTFDGAVQREGNPISFRDTYWAYGEKRHRELFAIQNPRRDAVFAADAVERLELPFRNPQDMNVQSWLADNVEAAWSLDAFQLRLLFAYDRRHDMAYVVFVPGATPNVNGLGGSRITMDANRSIEEYLVRWTIRHEFGHVLGFPDCYVEFYDAPRGVMVNYQVDLSNIMCSRLGQVQPLHVAEIKRVYGAR